MNQRLILLGCLVLILVSRTLVVAEIGFAQGVIRGTIINGTPSGGSVENQEVVLHVQREGSEMEPLAVRSDSLGDFEFVNLSTETGYTYYLSLNYQEAEYTSDVVSFESSEVLLPVDLIVFDATESDENIHIAINHLMIEKAQQGTLIVSETFIFSNNGNRTYIGQINTSSGQRETLRIPLPQGFQDLEYEQGLMECCITQTKDALVDTMDLKPGLKKVVFWYKLRYSGTGYRLEKYFPYNTTAFYALTPAAFQLSGEGLSSEGPLEIQGRQYVALGTEELPPGSQVTIGISGLPFSWGRNLRVAVVGLILALVVAGVSYALLRKGKEKMTPEKTRKAEVFLQSEEYLKGKRKALLSLIAHLDDQCEAKQISEQIYGEMRQEFKKRLVKIMETLAHRQAGNRRSEE